MSKSGGPERAIQKAVMEMMVVTWPAIWFWEQKGAAVNRLRRLSKFARKGLPDIMGYWPAGVGCNIETKSRDGRLSFEQKNFRDICHRRGITYIVARSREEAHVLLLKEVSDRPWLMVAAQDEILP